MKNRLLLEDIIKTILLEQPAQWIRSLISLGGRAFDDMVKLSVRDIDGKLLQSGDDIVNALKAGTLSAAEMGKVYTGLLKTNSKNLPLSLQRELMDAIAEKAVGKYSKNMFKVNGGVNEYAIIKELQRIGYPGDIAKQLADRISTKVKNIGQAGTVAPEVVAPTVAPEVAPSVAPAVAPTTAATAAAVSRKFIYTTVQTEVRHIPQLNNKKMINLITDQVYGKIQGKSESEIIDMVDKIINDKSKRFTYGRGKEVVSGWGKVVHGIGTAGKVGVGVFGLALAAIPVVVYYYVSSFLNKGAGENINSIGNTLGISDNPEWQTILNTLGSDSTSTGGQSEPNKTSNISPKLQQIMTKYNVSPSKTAYGDDIVRIDRYPGGGIILYLDTPTGGRVQSISDPSKTGTWSIDQLNEGFSLYNLVMEQSTEMSPKEMSNLAYQINDQLNGDVMDTDSKDIADALELLKTAVGKTYKGLNAVEGLRRVFQRQYGETLDEKSTSFSSLDPMGQEAQDEFLEILKTGGGGSGNLVNQVSDGIKIAWNGIKNDISSIDLNGQTQAANIQQPQQEPQVQTQQPEPQQVQPQAQPQQPQNNGRPKLTFRQCQGTYTPGCLNTVAIAQVQRCLDLVSDRYPRGSGYFDYDLQDKLAAMGYKNGFTDADVDKICHAEATSTKPFQTQENDTPGDNPNASTESPRQTYEKYYARLDGKETDRVKLKINNLPDSDLSNLNKYFATQGLYKIINPKRRYGTKFVWGKKPS